MMTLEQIKMELNRIVEDMKLVQPDVHVEKVGKWIHILISTASFRGLSASERNNVVWREFERRFDDETILAITQCYLLTPEQSQTAVPA